MTRALGIILLLAAAPLCATEGAAYLKSIEGPRAAGMAGAMGAMPGSAESLWYNPAGLSGMKGAELSFSHYGIDNAYDSDHIAAGAFLGWQNSFGVLYSRKAANDSYRDAFGNASGSFEVSSSVLGLGYAYDLGALSVGLGYKLLSEKVEKLSGSGSAYDIGIQGSLGEDRALYGLSYQNLGSAPSLGGAKGVELPQSLRASLGWRFGDPSQSFQVLADYQQYMVSHKGAFSLGAEYAEEYGDNSLALRAGYTTAEHDLGGLSGLSAGLGFGYRFMSVDYSYQPLDVLGGSHRISLTLTYDLKAKTSESNVTEFLGLTGAAQLKPAAAPVKVPPANPDRHIGESLEALLATTPSPTPLPTPEPQAAPAPTRGILGAIFSFFGGSTKKEAEEPKRPGGILRSFFSIFGISSNEDQPAQLPEKPGMAIPGSEDKFVDPNAAPQGGADAPAPTPTAVVTPVLEKVKGWLKF